MVAPIGIFDSGLGGISVWQALHDALPEESLIYLGDGARCPYGARTLEEVRDFTFEAVERLLAEGCKMIVLACNTATAVAIKELRECYPNVPFVGLEPAVKPAALTTKSGVIGVLATKRSLEGDHFRRAEEKYGAEVRILKAVGEGFVEAVENNKEQSPETETLVRRVVEPLVEQGVDKLGTLLALAALDEGTELGGHGDKLHRVALEYHLRFLFHIHKFRINAVFKKNKCCIDSVGRIYFHLI